MKPFILIVGLFRSGTTLAQELLIEKNKSFIFHEPRFFDMAWQFQEHDRNYLAKEWNMILPQFGSTAEVWEFFMEELGLQIGAKEIRNAASMEYYNSWGGNCRLLVIDRRPAEIYKSCYKMFMRSNESFQWRPHFSPFNPVNLFREVAPEIKNINGLWNQFHPKCKMVMDYRDLIDEDATARGEMYAWLQSDVSAPEIGKYHAILPRGKYETGLHKGQITDRATGLSEIPNKIKDEARKFETLLQGAKTWI
jgi:hypothetical protein